MSMQNVKHFQFIVNDSILTMTISLSVMKRVISDTKVYCTSLSEAFSQVLLTDTLKIKIKSHFENDKKLAFGF
jgi:hypothetical protein